MRPSKADSEIGSRHGPATTETKSAVNATKSLHNGKPITVHVYNQYRLMKFAAVKINVTCCAKFSSWRYEYVADSNRTRASARISTLDEITVMFNSR